jgi:hypothetical protein
MLSEGGLMVTKNSFYFYEESQWGTQEVISASDDCLGLIYALFLRSPFLNITIK